MSKKDKSEKSGEERPDLEELKKLPLLNIEYDLYYHGIKPLKKLNLSRLKYLAVVFIVLGLIIIYYLASSAPAIYANVQDVYGNYLYNYAVVVLEGNVSDIPSVRIDTQGRYAVYFTISDGSASISLRIYDPLARKALAEGLVPGVGDHVKAEVQIRVLETYTYGIIQSLSTMKITHVYEMYKPLKTDALSTEMVGRYVEMQGVITGVRVTSRGLYLIYIDTGADNIVAVLPDYLKYVNATIDPKTNTLTPNPLFDKVISKLVIGATLTIRGVVHLYRGTPELVVSKLTDINVNMTITSNMTIDKIVFDNDKYVGKYVVLRNAWMGPVSYDSKAGTYWVEIYDDTYHTTAIFLSRDFRDAVNPFIVGTGSRMTIIGAVCNDTTIAVVNFNITSTRPAPLMKPSQVTPSMKGYMVALEGIVEVESTSTKTESYGCPICDYYHGVTSVGSVYRFKLVDPDDPSIKITVFMPGSAYNYLDAKYKRLLRTSGSRVIIAGYIDIYNDELELVAFSSQGVMSINETPPGKGLTLPEPPPYKPVNYIKKISEVLNMTGETVVLDVYLDEVTYSYGKIMLKVHDDTGSIDVYVSPSIMDKLNPYNLSSGSELVVFGKVSGRKTKFIEATDIVVYTPRRPETISVASLTPDYNGKIVVIEGVVESMSGRTLVVNDGTGSITVIIDPSTQLPSDVIANLYEGVRIKAAGVVIYSVGKPELHIFSSKGIIIVSQG